MNKPSQPDRFDPTFSTWLQAAMRWHAATGWPSRKQDLALAIRFVAELAEDDYLKPHIGMRLLARLVDTWAAEAGHEEARYRAILTRVVVERGFLALGTRP